MEAGHLSPLDWIVYDIPSDGVGELDIVEVYDTKNDEVDSERRITTSSHGSPRLAAENNGKIYVVGSFLETDKLFIYEPSSDKWTNCAPLHHRVN
jgi:hypothetical protein